METEIQKELKRELKFNSAEEYMAYFKNLANILMNKCVIRKGKVRYEIIEIEFYLFNSQHPDIIAYPRDCVAGQWYFHPSGVDLTFTTTDKQFGGILIRGLREVGGERKQIFGPQNCVNLLWDKFNAFEVIASELPTIIASDGSIETYPIASFPRWIPVKKDKVKASTKIDEWGKRVKEKGYNYLNKNEEISVLVFESEYRFIKESSINFNDNAWKRYNAKIHKA